MYADEFSEHIEWLDEHIWDQSIPESRTKSYVLNLAMMKYDLEKTRTRRQSLISVDFWNPYNTFRSNPHKKGFILVDSEYSYHRSLGGRLNGMFKADCDGDAPCEVIDVACDKLIEYFSGSLTEIVYTVRDCVMNKEEDPE